MAKISTKATAAQLLELFDAIPEGVALTPDQLSLREAIREEQAEDTKKQALQTAHDAVAEKVKAYTEKHLAPLEIPEAVDFIGIDFTLDESGKFIPTNNMRTLYAGGNASEEMQELCAALTLLETNDNVSKDAFAALDDTIGDSIGAERFAQIVSQSQFDRKTIDAVYTKSHSQHFTNGIDIPDDVKTGSIEIVYNSAAYMKEHGTTAEAKLSGAGWATLKCDLGKKSRSGGTRKASTNGKDKVPGYKTNWDYLDVIGDDKYKEKVDEAKEKKGDLWHKSVNASQHIERIEKGFTDDAEKLWHIAKGLI